MRVPTSRRDFLKASAAAWATPTILGVGQGAFGLPMYGPISGQPAGEIPDWGNEPVEVETDKRATICLNGLWRVMPAVDGSWQEPTGDWGYIRVPGSWQESENRIPGIVSSGKGEPWPGFRGNRLSRMWFERPIHVPANWTGAILVTFHRISTDALVFVNDQPCGEVHWPEGTVDITHAVNPGKDTMLRLLVIATPEVSEVGSLLANAEPGAGDQDVTANQHRHHEPLASRGIVGDVLLQSRPLGAHVADVHVKTSTRRKTIAIETELADVAQSGNVHFTVIIVSANGHEERRFESSMSVDAAPVQTVAPEWSWLDPQLWDVGEPNLYSLVIKVQGAGIDDAVKQTMGFREFWIEGRKMYLNGKELRWRPVMGHPTARAVIEEVDGTIDGFRWAGYNFQEIWPSDNSARGMPDEYRMWYERADLKGWPINGVLVDFAGYADTWSDPETKERFRAIGAAEIKRYRNHPSIIVWSTSPNYARGDEHPRLLGNRAAAWNTLGPWTDNRFSANQEAIEILRSLDGTRPVISHHSGAVGDVYTLNEYLDFIPLQEREEWLSYWAAFGDMPFFCPEFGTPLQTSFHRGRRGFDQAIATEPLATEFCAIYQGSQAYAGEMEEYREQIRKLFKGDQLYARWQDNPFEIYAPNFQRIQELFIRNTWRSWRAMGNTGGMFPWSNGHGWDTSSEGGKEDPLPPFEPGRRGFYFTTAPRANVYWMKPQAAKMLPGGKALLENNQPTLAWICGPGGLPNPGVAGPDDAFTAKDHNFRTGQKIQKQVALLNDTRYRQNYSVRWEATIAGTGLGSGSIRGTIDPAQTLFVPLQFTAPATIKGQKTKGRISMSSEIGEAKHQDAFDFTVFAASPLNPRHLAAYDPAGQTTNLLRKLGYSVNEWDQTMAQPLIVVGRSALTARPVLLRELEPLVRDGARVIVFIQDPEFMRRRLGLRVAWHMSRNAYPVDANHQILAGLDSSDLRDWTGSSSLLNGYPLDTVDVEKPFPYSWEPPMALYGWRWGGRGAVSSGTIEKPHKGSWRPILEDQFDLAYSPLMELDYGKGRLIWCMLDLEDHAAEDPAALLLAGQLLDYAENAVLTPKARRAIYCGGVTGAKLVNEIGLIYESNGEIPDNADLVVIGEDNDLSEDVLKDFIERGGRALVLPQRDTSLPLGATQKKVDSFHGSLDVPDWPEARGLSRSDLRWRSDAATYLITSGAEIGADGMLARKVIGKGVLIYCQLDPGRFDADVNTYFRFTRWRQMRALCQVLSNLGARFEADELIFNTIQASAATNPWISEPVQQPSGFYRSDYITDYEIGDDPYRYYNW